MKHCTIDEYKEISEQMKRAHKEMLKLDELLMTKFDLKYSIQTNKIFIAIDKTTDGLLKSVKRDCGKAWDDNKDGEFGFYRENNE